MEVRQDLARAAIERLAAPLRPGRDGDGAGDHLGRHRQHGAGDPRDLRAARPRSARLHAGGVRRRRPAARGAAGAGAGHRPHPGAAQSRHPVRDGPAADRSARRFRHDAAAHAVDRRRCPMSSMRSTRCARRPRLVRGRRDRAECAPDHAHGRHALCRTELRIAGCAAGRRDRTATLDALAEGFAAAHQRMYGFVAEDEPVQLVTFRVEAVGVVPKASFQRHPDAGSDASTRH